MKKITLLIFASAVLVSCTSSTDIASIDKKLESSSKSLGNVNMVNDITNQNQVKGEQTVADDSQDIELSRDDQRAIAENEKKGSGQAKTVKPSSKPQTSMDPIDKDTTTLQVQEKQPGTGVEAVEGKMVLVHYVGKLTNGSEFDNSYKRGQPISFTLGAGQVIQGWDIGIAGMKVGGKRHLVIPPQLAYGNNSPTPDIPNGATLIFDVELVDVK